MWNLIRYYAMGMTTREKIELYFWIALTIFDGVLLLYIIYGLISGNF
jgi:hypothetical protein